MSLYGNHSQKGDEHPLMGEKGKNLSWFHQMGPLKLGANACIAPKFFLTFANACTQRNHANRGGEGFETISKDF